MVSSWKACSTNLEQRSFAVCVYSKSTLTGQCESGLGSDFQFHLSGCTDLSLGWTGKSSLLCLSSRLNQTDRACLSVCMSYCLFACRTDCLCLIQFLSRSQFAPPIPISASFYLWVTHYKHTHAYTHTHTHTLIHTCTDTDTISPRPLTHTRTLVHTRQITRTHTQPIANPHTRTLLYTVQIQTYTHTSICFGTTWFSHKHDDENPNFHQLYLCIFALLFLLPGTRAMEGLISRVFYGICSPWGTLHRLCYCNHSQW